MNRPRTALGTALLTLSLLGAAATVAPSGAEASGGEVRLPLGAVDLPETRTTTTVQPGVTVTRIDRGVADTADSWTVEVSSPDATDPDPDAPAVAITDREEADRTADVLRHRGLVVRVEAVRTPRTADTGGLLGYRVRVGSFATSDATAATSATVTDAGYSPATVFTGWDGDAGATPTRGSWHLEVVTIDPRRFTGRVVGDYGPDFVGRETTSALAQQAGATVAINAGFFVLDPAAGAPGDPAGVGVYRGRIESETTNGRPALLIHARTARASIQRLWWRGRLVVRDSRSRPKILRLNGLNRVPGLIRNCGEPGVRPLSRPQQDVTCTRASETVAFDRAYGDTAPARVDAEVVLAADGSVRSVDTTGGAPIPQHGRVVQAIGRAAPRLLSLARHARRISVSSALRRADGERLRLTRDLTVVNGAPMLVQHGRVAATPRRDGAVHPGEPSFYYGWAHKRNPRTFAGVDRAGRLVLVTADGRSTDSLGLSIAETARVARSLGLVSAMNLDGGGSTTAVVDGRVVNDPSDATGERPVGDALGVLPAG